ncbi:MAG: alpha/beta hydrolase family protein, partial [Isosphaeraceae bacterium]
AGFFPPTDFLNYGKEGSDALGRGVLAAFKAPFDFEELDRKRNVFVPIVDEAERKEIGRKISPITHVSSDDPPTLLFHGDADLLVPIQQSERIIAKLNEAKVPARLVVKTGEKHGWATMPEDLNVFADWFDKHLTPHGNDGD